VEFKNRTFTNPLSLIQNSNSEFTNENSRIKNAAFSSYLKESQIGKRQKSSKNRKMK